MDNSNVILQSCSFLGEREEKEGENMCYATKRKIADCVKLLMRRKEISKITIQDIMDETHMSRQSFYYHFKDIYDVLEWIGLNDFKSQLVGNDYDSMEVWGCDLMRVLKRERTYYEKLANEIEWPRIVRCVNRALEAQVRRLLLLEHAEVFRNHPEELESAVEFLATSICYYMIDYVYRRKNLSDERVQKDIRFVLRAINGGEKPETLVFSKVAVV